jgi:hypothetical protein
MMLLGQALAVAGIPFTEAKAVRRGAHVTIKSIVLRSEDDREATLAMLQLSFENPTIEDGAIRVATPEEIAESDRWQE